MTELLTAAQMRALEAEAIASGSVTGAELMDRAGAGVVAAVFEEWPELGEGPHRAIVLCGPGNNGGDGFVVARLLAEAGWSVDVFLYGDADKLPPDARAKYERWCAQGVVHPWGDLDAEKTPASLYIDAVFGTGLSRPVPKEVSRQLLMATLHVKQRTKIVGVDVPSGLCADSGNVLGNNGAYCDLVVTFHAAKLGLLLGQGPVRSKRLRCVDIGLERKFEDGDVHLIDQQWLSADAIPNLFKWTFRHKFSHGHALLLTGGPGCTGAARLAARGALRIGAGVVTLGVPPSSQMEVASQISALMLARVRDEAALMSVLADRRINALCIGPGLGLDERAGALVDAVLRSEHLCDDRRVVFDADALSLIAANPDRMAALNEHAVLTPHGGEFARLFPDIAERLAAVPDRGTIYSKVDATRAAAARSGAIVLFKGPDTVIAHPDGRASIHAALYDREAPWLATAGAGDVLAGFITGLLARGFDPMEAAETAAWLHVECARAFGPGLIAEDLPETLPQVLRELGA
ncbi:NAD(P)H-hydrate dehydratase [uncultured Tateyamaria sp.]|uniref:NAD(P)H-hydrate dehydratase n=1 Tax=uncultured Tateyamaria sp. TaxID=455651 RepID=UPI00261312AA|nr:NAD(P)H-hydrate dehydratase [uncultured Tateyamaria sp.]